MNDETFKEEIVRFNVDTEASVVEDDHRKGLLPVLMRFDSDFS